MRMPRSRVAPVVLSLATLVLAACGTDDGAGSGTSVVAGFYPLEWTAQRVGGDRVEVSSLTPPGAEAHDLELAPRDVGAIADADLLVYLAGFQPAIDEAATAEARDRAWDAGAAADLSLTAEPHEDHGQEHGEDHGQEHAEEHGDEHGDEHGAEHGAEQADEHADEEVLDPHFWLDPLRLADVGDALADELAEIDAEGAETYRANADDLRAELEALDAEMSDALDDCRVDTLVTSHDAFGYLAERYGFEVVGISGVSPSQEPDPAGLAEIADLVEERGVTTVYTETLVDPAVARTVADEAGVRTAVLDPLEGLTDESAGSDYLQVMRSNLEVLTEGQDCG